jgi:hypothetical protein
LAEDFLGDNLETLGECLGFLGERTDLIFSLIASLEITTAGALRDDLWGLYSFGGVLVYASYCYNF